jgi:NAD(P)-dependent dehydrogenase (short-subunit alcohol dehydrogenase family)
MSELRGKIVVLTGGSSGIGRAAALEFVRRGARVIVAARRAAELEETVRLCEQLGGQALAVPTDVTKADDVANLFERSMAVDGRIDIWVNNAGTTLFNRLDLAHFEEHRSVIETNLFGAMRCAAWVMPLFKRQRRGVLINVGSILSKIGQPYVPSYTISKFALRGLSEAMRTDIADMPEVHVCTLLPYAISTPHFDTAANHTGLGPHPMPPVQTPEKVARALVDLAASPRRERHVPRIAYLGLLLHELLPRPVERTLLHVLANFHVGPDRMADRIGTLHAGGVTPGAIQGRRAPRLDSADLFRWILTHFVKIMTQPAPSRGR